MTHPMKGHTPNHQIATQIIIMMNHREHQIATNQYDDEPLDDYIENLLACIIGESNTEDEFDKLEEQLMEIAKIAKSENWDWNQIAHFLQLQTNF
jgi:hypothetical protein